MQSNDGVGVGKGVGTIVGSAVGVGIGKGVGISFVTFFGYSGLLFMPSVIGLSMKAGATVFIRTPFGP